jgi:hypothetical protein
LIGFFIIIFLAGLVDRRACESGIVETAGSNSYLHNSKYAGVYIYAISLALPVPWWFACA